MWDKKSLKEYVDNQIYTGESDFEIIARYLLENQLESEGIDLITMILKGRIKEQQRTIDNARSWIPTMISNSRANRTGKPEYRTTEDEEMMFTKLTCKYILEMDLSEEEIERAKEVFTNRKCPKVIFMPMVEWLAKKYKIKFKDC